MSLAYACDQTAVLKILLHSAKYPAAAVNGILLGKRSSDSKAVQIQDAIPLLHSFLTLAPSLETALIQVSSYAQQQQGLELVGYYHANERFNDSELGAAAQKIADKLQANNSVACALLVSKHAIAVLDTTHLLKQKHFGRLQLLKSQLYVKDDAGRAWNKVSADSSKLKYDSASVLDVFQEMCSQGRHRQLSDFDDHLNDLSRDWRNQDLLN